MTKPIRLIVRLVSLALILSLVAGGSVYGWRRYSKSHVALSLPTATARQGEFLVILRCRGELVAHRSEQVIAPLDAPELQIVWLAPAGGAVKKGDVIIRFDTSRAQQDLKDRNASLAQAQATLDQALVQARIGADQDVIDLANAEFQVNKARLEASKQTIVSAIQGEESSIDLGLAEQRLKVQRASEITHKTSAEARIAALTRARDTAKMQVEITEKQLASMEMKSPLDGVINYMSNYSQGWVNAQPFKVGDHAVSGGVLAEIPDLSTLQIEAKLDEVDRGKVSAGSGVVVHVDAFPEKTMTAKVAAISPLAEQSFNEWPPTRSFRAFAVIDQPDPRLRPGMNAGADVVEERIPGAISVPSKAIFSLGGQPVVYVKRNSVWSPISVKIRARNPDEFAIEGIEAGTQVALTEPPTAKP